LIDRDGRMIFEPKYGFIAAIGPDRFRVSEPRRLGGTVGGEDLSGIGGVSIFGLPIEFTAVMDIFGQWIEPPSASQPREFDKDDPSIRCKETSCGGWRAPTGAGLSSRSSSGPIH
jgi:hypothetical protein